jgi:hypothetical protein
VSGAWILTNLTGNENSEFVIDRKKARAYKARERYLILLVISDTIQYISYLKHSFPHHKKIIIMEKFIRTPNKLNWVRLNDDVTFVSSQRDFFYSFRDFCLSLLLFVCLKRDDVTGYYQYTV